MRYCWCKCNKTFNCKEQLLSENSSKTADRTLPASLHLPVLPVERLPAFLGEKDIMTGIFYWLESKGRTEGVRGIFVRGGSPDQNLILFHKCTVYNALRISIWFLIGIYHGGTQQMDIYKSYIPVQYGGRLSSVIINPNYGKYGQLEFMISASV